MSKKKQVIHIYPHIMQRVVKVSHYSGAELGKAVVVERLMPSMDVLGQYKYALLAALICLAIHAIWHEVNK